GKTSQTIGSNTSTVAQFDLGGIMERVSHAIRPEVASNSAKVEGRNYTAIFDGNGTRFSPHLPSQQNQSSVPVSLSSVVNASQSSVHGNAIRARLQNTATPVFPQQDS